MTRESRDEYRFVATRGGAPCWSVWIMQVKGTLDLATNSVLEVLEEGNLIVCV